MAFDMLNEQSMTLPKELPARLPKEVGLGESYTLTLTLTPSQYVSREAEQLHALREFGISRYGSRARGT